MKHGNQSQARLEAERAAAKKKSEIDDLKDLNKLLRPVTEMPKVAKGEFFIDVFSHFFSFHFIF